MGKACECGCFCFAIYIRLGLMIASLAIGCEYLFPVINYPKMEEPVIEEDNLSIIESRDPEKYKCYLIHSQNEDIISELKIKKIKTFSTGLISLLFMQLAIEVMFYVVLIASCCCISKDRLLYCTLFYLIISGIISALHLLFFILFAVNYFKGKKLAKTFTVCDIISFYENCGKFIIGDLIFIFFYFWGYCISWVKNGKEN